MRLKRVTGLDVARRAGVSRTTVSLVLNKVSNDRLRPETIDRVLQAARELGYVPDAAARALASRRAGTAALILAQQGGGMAGEAHFDSTLAGLTAVFHEKGMRLLVDLVNDMDNPQPFFDLVQSGQIDGLILAGARVQEEALLNWLGGALPVVLLGSPGTRLASVTVNHTAAARAVTVHLAQQGARRIALICHDPRVYADAADMLLGYRLGLEAAGQPFDEELVRPGPLDPLTGSQQMTALFNLSRLPDAVFATADLLVLGALPVIQARGARVPADLALAGYGDIPLAAYAVPPLTSMRLPAGEMARQAAEMLVEMIHRQQPARQVMLEAEMKIRASSAAR